FGRFTFAVRIKKIVANNWYVDAFATRTQAAFEPAHLRGNEKVVELLLSKGAEVNAQGGEYGNALQAASRTGNEKVVELLLSKGAEVNAQGGGYGNALQAASWRGSEKVVELLLSKGAVSKIAS